MTKENVKDLESWDMDSIVLIYSWGSITNNPT